MKAASIHPTAREAVSWRIPGGATGGHEASFDDGATWHPLSDLTPGDGAVEVGVTIAGPLAQSQDGDVVLQRGVHQVLVRGVREQGVRTVGVVTVQGSNVYWPIDWGCKPDIDQVDPALRYRSEQLAISTLRSLTAGQVGGPVRTVRPCRPAPSWPRIGYGLTRPMGNGSDLLTVGCSCNGSSHDCGNSSASIYLPPPVGQVRQVKIDGAVLDRGAYRMNKGSTLVRTDGGLFPLRQRPDIPDTEQGTFSITYVHGALPGPLGAWVAGVLAAEFIKACSGDRGCRLPSGVTNVARQGVTYQIRADMFDGGLTGIHEVDAYTGTYNPNRLASRPMVYTPDLEN